MTRGEILAQLRERILAFAASRMRRDIAEDLAQEVLIVIEQKYSELTELTDLLPLSLQITRFKMAGVRRKSVRRGESGQISVEDIQLASPTATPEEQARRKESVERLTAAVQKLGERCRELFRLKLLGRSFAEIQEALGAASINTVYTWDARCRKNLLDLMGGKWDA
jgi:RNA polymerase sigma-70 factor (ECF subfamily)